MIHNLHNEEPWPLHHTVVFALSAPDMTAHKASELCPIEHPHAISECGEYHPASARAAMA